MEARGAVGLGRGAWAVPESMQGGWGDDVESMDRDRSQMEGQPPQIPEHRLLRLIGSGSYGDVWLAQSTTGAWRAIKVVWRTLFRDVRPFDREWTGVQRFEPLSRESEAFVDVLQTGRAEDAEYFYYVMELADDARFEGEGLPGDGPLPCDGRGYVPRTLAWVLRHEGRMSSTDCLALARRLALGLDCLHQAGLLHRDVKPSNIVYVRGQPRLADIGLVTDLGAARSYVGTDGYIPIEGPNSVQADIFGLGKVLYEVTSGLDRMEFPRMPVGREDGPSGALRLEINAVVLRACAASKEARYPTARAMVEDLGVIAAGGSVRGGRGPLSATRRDGVLRPRVASLVLVALALWASAGWWRARKGSASSRDVGPTAATRSAADVQRVLDLGQSLRLWTEGDASGALLWASRSMQAGEGTEALADRVRVGQMLEDLPRMEAVLHCGPGLYSAAFSPDGRRVATSDRSGFIQVWDVETGARVGGPWSTGGHVVRVRYSSDGRCVMVVPPIEHPAIRGDEGLGKAQWLDATTGEALRGGMDRVLWGVFSDEGDWVACVRASHVVAVSARGGPAGAVRELGAHGKPVEGLAFSRDQLRIASVSDDQTGKVWDVSTGREVCPPLALAGQGLAVAFNPAGDGLWTFSMDGSRRAALERWRLVPEALRTSVEWMDGPSRRLQRIGGDQPAILAVANSHGARCFRESGGESASEITFGPSGASHWASSPDGRCLLVGAVDGTARIYDLRSGRRMGVLPKLARGVVDASFSADSRRVLVAGTDGLLRVWSGGDSMPGRPQLPEGAVWGEDAPGERMIPAAMDPQGRFILAVASVGGATRLFEIPLDGRLARKVNGDPAGFPVHAIQGSADGRWWTTRHVRGENPRGPVNVWLGQYADGRWTSMDLPHSSGCRAVQFEDDGQHLLTVDDAGLWRRWGAAAGQCVEQQLIPVALGAGIAASTRGGLVATVDANLREVLAWEWPRSGSPLARWSGPLGIQVLRFLPGSELLVMEDINRARWLLDARAGRPVSVAPGSLDGGVLAGWHGPSQRILHVLDSSAVEIVDVSTSRVLRWKQDVGDRGVRMASLSSDGRWVAVADRENGVQVFESSSGQPVSRRRDAGGRVRWMSFAPGGALVVLVEPNGWITWPLPPFMGRVDELEALAITLSGRRHDGHGGIEWLSPEALAEHVASARPRRR
ncbi:MAG: protein kinase [Verrucomicrobiota bacterium]